MFKKAFTYDDSTVFYFDRHDNKYVAKGGGLAWRLNNPGLISSHSMIAKEFRSIGSHKQHAIFCDQLIGNDAHRAWLVSSKYCDSPLVEICKYYQPNDSEGFLQKLCAATSLQQKTKPRTLSGQDFERLLKAIQKLLGFGSDHRGEFYLLPKITSRFCSRDRNVEYYLVGHENLLMPKEALKWVETHRLDAVIVHKKNGTIYLRSRPGHHFNQIHLADEEYGQENEFEDAIRDIGKKQPGQCIWGYVNGISTPPSRAQECAALIEKYASGQQIWSLINDATPGTFGRLFDALGQKFNLPSDTVKNGVHFLKFLINLSNQDSSSPPVVIFAHSQGALIMNLALEQLNPDERNRVHIFTFGAAKFVSPGKAHVSHNYLSIADPVPMFASKDTYRFLLHLHEGKKRGLTPADIIQECVKQDLICDYQEFSTDTPLEFLKERQIHYENELIKTQNITLLESTESDFWEHSFDLPSYQSIIKEIVERYNK